MEQVEQAGGGFNGIAEFAERNVTFDRAEADQIFAFSRLRRVQAKRFARGVVAGELAGGFDAVARFRRVDVDRAAPEKPKPPIGRRDDGGFDSSLRCASINDQIDAPA